MKDFTIKLGSAFLFSLCTLFLLSLTAAASLGHDKISSHPGIIHNSGTHGEDERATPIARLDQGAKPSDSFEGSRTHTDALRLAQTLPFQAPSTPEIETQPRVKRPGQGTASKVEAAGPTQKHDKSTIIESKTQSEGDRGQGRTVTPSHTNTPKKKSVGVKPKAYSGIESPSARKPSEIPASEPIKPSSFSGGVSSSSSMPPLPPAMPYTPPSSVYRAAQGATPAPAVKLPQPNPTPAGLSKPKALDSELPSATRTGTERSLDNFVLDSFKGGISEGSAVEGQRDKPQVPPASLIGQLSQDMKQLGEGIKKTFRNLLSLR